MAVAERFDSMFTPDGTQEPSPPFVVFDPVAGLVAGTAMTESSNQDGPVLPIAEPVEPDAGMVRKAVEAALAEEQGEYVSRQQSGSDERRSTPVETPRGMRIAPVRSVAARSVVPRIHRPVRERITRRAAVVPRLNTAQPLRITRARGKSSMVTVILALILIVVMFELFSSVAVWVNHLFH